MPGVTAGPSIALFLLLVLAVVSSSFNSRFHCFHCFCRFSLSKVHSILLLKVYMYYCTTLRYYYAPLSRCLSRLPAIPTDTHHACDSDCYWYTMHIT